MESSRTIAAMFEKRCNKNPDDIAIGWVSKSELKTYRYDHYQSLIHAIAANLNRLGVKKGDKIAILADTCKEWHLIDITCLCIGVTVVPIYHTYTEKEVEFILNHSGAKVIFVDENIQLKKLLKIKDQLEHLKLLLSLNDIESYSTLGFENHTFHSLTFNDRPEGENKKIFNEIVESIDEEDIATIVYTSGTTGEPKGAVITQKALCSMMFNLRASLSGSLGREDRTLCFLPLSHVFGRADSLLHLPFGMTVVYAESIEKIIPNLNLVKPTIMLSVPRIFEKFYAKVMQTFEDGPIYKKKLFQWAMASSDQYFSKIEKDLAPNSSEIVQKNLAYKLVFSKIYEKFGGKIRFFVSGGAPLSIEIINFLRNANLTVLEGYGLTETVAPCTVNPPSKQVAGTVGIPIGDVELDFAEDGEILVRSKALLKEYFKNEVATKETIDQEGWLHTGDIGELTTEGYLKITDRKKDIIITAGGKNIAPQKIENLMKLQKYISHFLVIGDKQKYLTAIIGIEAESFKDDIQKLGLSEPINIKSLSTNPKVINALKEQVDAVNLDLARYETIKKFYVAPVEFSVEGGELTPSLKLKKKVLIERYKDDVDAMY